MRLPVHRTLLLHILLTPVFRHVPVSCQVCPHLAAPNVQSPVARPLFSLLTMLALCSKVTMVKKPFFLILTKAALPSQCSKLRVPCPNSLLVLRLPGLALTDVPQCQEDARRYWVLRGVY